MQRDLNVGLTEYFLRYVFVHILCVFHNFSSLKFVLKILLNKKKLRF